MVHRATANVVEDAEGCQGLAAEPARCQGIDGGKVVDRLGAGGGTQERGAGDLFAEPPGAARPDAVADGRDALGCRGAVGDQAAPLGLQRPEAYLRHLV